MTNTYAGVATATSGLGGWAEVSAAGQTTRYIRFGTKNGTPVIILPPRDSESSVWPDLTESVAADRPVYLPDLPNDERTFVDRMLAFFDGVGLEKASLVAPENFAAAALEFARREPDRLTTLVLVPTTREDERALTELVATARLAETVRLIVVGEGLSVANAVEEVIR